MLNKKISILIVNYRSEKYLEKCIASLYLKIKNKIEAEILIINNDSKTKLIKVAKKYPSVQIINSQKNIGFGAGHNLGVKQAQGEFLFFLNPDAEILSVNIQKIITLLENNTKIGILGGKLIDDFGVVQKWNAGAQLDFKELIKNNLGLTRSKNFWQSQTKQEVDWVSGAALLIRKNDFIKVGGFDEKFFMYFEDLDLCRRIKNQKKQILFYPDLLIKHEGGKSYSNPKKQKKDFYLSQEYYFEKYSNSIITSIIKTIRRMINLFS